MKVLILEPKKVGSRPFTRDVRKAKTSNLLVISDKNGFIASQPKIIAGNHHDNYQLKPDLSSFLKWRKIWGSG